MVKSYLYINNKVKRMTGLIHKFKHYLIISAMKTYYSSLILPTLNYGFLAWGISTTVYISNKKAIRAITNSN